LSKPVGTALTRQDPNPPHRRCGGVRADV
jgi:hypothetical protein